MAGGWSPGHAAWLQRRRPQAYKVPAGPRQLGHRLSLMSRMRRRTSRSTARPWAAPVHTANGCFPLSQRGERLVSRPIRAAHSRSWTSIWSHRLPDLQDVLWNRMTTLVNRGPARPGARAPRSSHSYGATEGGYVWGSGRLRSGGLGGLQRRLQFIAAHARSTGFFVAAPRSSRLGHRGGRGRLGSAAAGACSAYIAKPVAATRTARCAPSRCLAVADRNRSAIYDTTNPFGPSKADHRRRHQRLRALCQAHRDSGATRAPTSARHTPHLGPSMSSAGAMNLRWRLLHRPRGHTAPHRHRQRPRRLLSLLRPARPPATFSTPSNQHTRKCADVTNSANRESIAQLALSRPCASGLGRDNWIHQPSQPSRPQHQQRAVCRPPRPTSDGWGTTCGKSSDAGLGCMP
jgi:hypothetical protein